MGARSDSDSELVAILHGSREGVRNTMTKRFIAGKAFPDKALSIIFHSTDDGRSEMPSCGVGLILRYRVICLSKGAARAGIKVQMDNPLSVEVRL